MTLSTTETGKFKVVEIFLRLSNADSTVHKVLTQSGNTDRLTTTRALSIRTTPVF